MANILHLIKSSIRDNTRIIKSSLYYHVAFFCVGLLFLIYGTISYSSYPEYHDMGKVYIRSNPEIFEITGGIRGVSNGRVTDSTSVTATLEYIVRGNKKKDAEVKVFFIKNYDSGIWNVKGHEVVSKW